MDAPIGAWDMQDAILGHGIPIAAAPDIDRAVGLVAEEDRVKRAAIEATAALLAATAVEPGVPAMCTRFACRHERQHQQGEQAAHLHVDTMAESDTKITAVERLVPGCVLMLRWRDERDR